MTMLSKTGEICFLIGSISLLTSITRAAPPINSSAKEPHNWFNPTPPDQLRELSPDRPDTTESPITLDAGHFMMEVSLYDWRRNRGDETHTLMASNLKIGLTECTDFQFVFDSYSWDRPADGGGAEGFSDVQLRLKHNLLGNDGVGAAFALFPYIKIPTRTALSNGAWEGGLILPFSTPLSGPFSLGLMAQVDLVHDDDSRDHQFQFLHTTVLGCDVTERLGAFAEYIGITTETAYEAYLAGGLTFTVNDNLVLDCGARAGLNEAAEEIGFFTGFTRRF